MKSNKKIWNLKTKSNIWTRNMQKRYNKPKL